ncbi:uncharacterized protein LOC119666142 [Teleopsis dalmanni]|uniref:uncharacterized protein LOC119666142 n=1 Tax=Teleopsis dalmanni TaxID=139649 RepID=UPI0018CE907F|nr:uncharacterized protein LOC119666142 [Teleopsis dalmanni]
MGLLTNTQSELIKDQYNLIKKLEELFKQAEGIVTRSKKNEVLELLEEIWKTFSENDKKLYKLGIEDIPYFNEGVGKDMLEKYTKAKKLLSNTEESEIDNPEDSVITTQEFKITREEAGKDKEMARDKLENLMKRLKGLEEMIKEFRTEAMKRSVLIRIIEGNYEKIQQILAILDKDQLSNINERYEMILEQAKVFLDCKDEFNHTKNQVKIEKEVITPITQLHDFDGRDEDWQTFVELFKDYVHNNRNLSSSMKLDYLRSHIKGDARMTISHLLSGTSANYEAAWDTNFDKLLDMKTITSSSVLSLRDAHDQIKQCIQLIESKQAEPNCDKLYAHIIIRKLDKEGIQLYEQYIKKPREINTLKDVFEFLEQQFQTLEAQNSLKTSRINYINPATDIRIQNNTIQCQCCNQLGHRMYNCKRFMDMSIGQRTSLIRNKQLCEICLSHNNRIKCNSTHKCKKCNKAHNSLLHMEYNLNQRQQNSRNNPKINKEGKTYSTIIKDKKQLTLLPTVLISTKSSDGNIHQLRALVDQGSQVSMVSEKVVQLLILKKMKHMTKLSGVSNTTVGTSNARVFMEISSRFGIKKKIKGEFLVMSHLVRSLPEETIEIETKIWDNYKLADPEFNKNGCIDMIIGSDLYPKIIKEGIKKYNNLIGQETIFGWMISGQILADAASNDVISTLNLERFWEIEEIENEKEKPNSDDELCLDLYKTTTIKDTDGRYIVQIPFKEDLSLGNSRKQAVARLLSLEKNINKKLKKEYAEFMREYEQLGHMVKTKDQNKGLYYMPHQAVIREKSLTTKLRVVFDASAKTSNGKSLNNIMMTGPRLQKDIFDIILKWRLWRFVVTADVEKMFRQIKITKEHQDYQRILWRENQTDKIEEFKLTTVTYGTASAAFLAVRTLQQIAGDYEGNVNIKNTIKNDFYMDDLLTGADTTSDCKDKINKIFNCLNSAGFKLRKWMSNNQSILENVPIEVSNKILNIKEDDSIKTLGLKWNPREDEFQFSINILTNDRITKRMVLSVNAKIFDPLGWLTPVTITAKLFIQKLWQLKYDWDEILDEQVHKEYEKNNKNIQIIEQTRIPRWMEVSSLDNWELHGFSDASEAAYAAAIYIKIGSKINLLTAKSKVAPIKNKKTIPKLELCGAHLLAKLMNKIIKILGNNPEVYCWSDSAITLWWIKEPRNKERFIRTRATEIKILIPSAEWRHIRTKENPADIASRGICASKLINNTLWWHGPTWLANPKEEWPKDDQIDGSAVIITTLSSDNNFINDLIQKISKISRLEKIVAYVLRFIKCLKNKSKDTNHISKEELDTARNEIIRQHQLTHFAAEISSINQGKEINRISKLIHLRPFIDKNGLLRVGGRLQNATIKYNQMHPTILHRDQYAELIIYQAHQSTLHGGQNLMEAHIKQQYWILGVRKAKTLENK